MKRVIGVLGGLSLLLSLGTAGIGTSGVSAKSQSFGMHLFGTFTKVHGQHKGATTTTPLVYQGGPVETTPSVYVVYWGTQWANGFSTGGYSSASAINYVNSFYSNVGGSPWDGINTQYCQGVAKGSISCNGTGTAITNPSGQLVDSWTDGSSLPRRISQSAIASEAVKLMLHFGGYKANTTYFVFTPSGHSMSGFGTQWCAWHSVTSSSGKNVPYAYMPYQPDAGGSCGENFVNSSNNSFGNGYFDGFSVVGGHEYAEALTDPITASGSYAWEDSSGSEIGDKCAWASNSANISLGGNNFAVQPLWSNANSGCVIQ